MESFQVTKNGKDNRLFNSFTSAIEYMIFCIKQEEITESLTDNHYELLYQQDKHIDHLAIFPNETGSIKKQNIHPYLQRIIQKGISDKNGYLHEINHNLLVLDELESKKYTIIKGNDSFLDLIKYIDITEYSLAYCPKCKRVQHCTIEGCEGLISFTCDNCNEAIFDAFRNK